jgi:LysR family transcriptional regulator, glycine cleavage system transcriptional activator
MQRLPAGVSLNAVRAFDAVARSESIKLAAEALFVTSGAVSHQLKQLEQALGVLLVHRSNNAVTLTDEGRAFAAAIGPALATIAQAAQRLTRDANSLDMHVSATLAMRWLIPRLDGFREQNPAIRVRLETTNEPAPHLQDDIDLAIVYTRGPSPHRLAQPLFADWCGLYGAPEIAGAARGIGDLVTAPLIAATQDDWDWRLWASANKLDFAQLNLRHRFDIDDAAIAAAQAGMGVVLAPEIFVRRECESGTLVAMPGTSAMRFGTYWVIPAPTARRPVEIMLGWLREVVGQDAL